MDEKEQLIDDVLLQQIEDALCVQTIFPGNGKSTGSIKKAEWLKDE